MAARATYPKLDVVLAQEHGMAAHQSHGGLGGNPRSRAALAEHHRHGLAGEDAAQARGNLAGLDGLLVRCGV